MNKAEIIKRIKAIITEHGCFSTAEVSAESSPMVAEINKNVYQLAERFYSNHTTTITYQQDSTFAKGVELDEEDIDYEILSNKVLSEILELAKTFEKSQISNS
jgi:hypothetical protein